MSKQTKVTLTVAGSAPRKSAQEIAAACVTKSNAEASQVEVTASGHVVWYQRNYTFGRLDRHHGRFNRAGRRWIRNFLMGKPDRDRVAIVTDLYNPWNKAA